MVIPHRCLLKMVGSIPLLPVHLRHRPCQLPQPRIPHADVLSSDVTPVLHLAPIDKSVQHDAVVIPPPLADIEQWYLFRQPIQKSPFFFVLLASEDDFPNIAHGDGFVGLQQRIYGLLNPFSDDGQPLIQFLCIRSVADGAVFPLIASHPDACVDVGDLPVDGHPHLYRGLVSR